MILLSLEKKFAFPDKLADVCIPLRILCMFPQTLHLLTKVGIPTRNFAFIRKSFVSLNFAFAHKSCVPTKKLHSLAKVLHPSKKLCVLHLNSPRTFFDYSQKVYITPSVGLGYLDLFILQL